MDFLCAFALFQLLGINKIVVIYNLRIPVSADIFLVINDPRDAVLIPQTITQVELNALSCQSP